MGPPGGDDGMQRRSAPLSAEPRLQALGNGRARSCRCHVCKGGCGGPLLLLHLARCLLGPIRQWGTELPNAAPDASEHAELPLVDLHRPQQHRQLLGLMRASPAFRTWLSGTSCMLSWISARTAASAAAKPCIAWDWRLRALAASG